MATKKNKQAKVKKVKKVKKTAAPRGRCRARRATASQIASKAEWAIAFALELEPHVTELMAAKARLTAVLQQLDEARAALQQLDEARGRRRRERSRQRRRGDEPGR